MGDGNRHKRSERLSRVQGFRLLELSPALSLTFALRNQVHHAKQVHLGHTGVTGGIISVVEMTASAPAAYLTCQFDEFLYARIDEGSDTTPLSVLSMLARLDLDPWEEAAKLAHLPRAAATKRLVDFVAATSGAPHNAKTVCDRLLNLLPSRVDTVVLPAARGYSVRALKKFPSIMWPGVIAVLLVILLIMMSI